MEYKNTVLSYHKEVPKTRLNPCSNGIQKYRGEMSAEELNWAS